MNPRSSLLQRVLDGRSDANLRFDELRGLLRDLGFTERVRGSHHIFRKEGVAERMNDPAEPHYYRVQGPTFLQRDDGHAKPYQVRQVRRVILRYGLEVNE